LNKLENETKVIQELLETSVENSILLTQANLEAPNGIATNQALVNKFHKGLPPTQKMEMHFTLTATSLIANKDEALSAFKNLRKVEGIENNKTQTLNNQINNDKLITDPDILEKDITSTSVKPTNLTFLEGKGELPSKQILNNNLNKEHNILTEGIVDPIGEKPKDDKVQVVKQETSRKSFVTDLLKERANMQGTLRSL
jgi:hypothetical protein